MINMAQRQQIRVKQDELIKRLLSIGLTELDVVIETPLQVITIGDLQTYVYPQFYDIIQEMLKHKEMTKWVIK